MGNVVFLLDFNGARVEKYTYDACGLPTVTDAKGGTPRPYSWYENRFMFTGREYFPELGIYDYRNRFYHPILGRFLQSDPIGFGGGDANLFRYCGGDPVNRRDPFGLTDSWRIGYQNENKGQGLSTRGFWSNPDGTPLGVGGGGPPSGGRLGSPGGGSWVDGAVIDLTGNNPRAGVVLQAFPSIFVPSVFSQQFGPGEISTLSLNPAIAWQDVTSRFTDFYVLPPGPRSTLGPISDWGRDHLSLDLNINVPVGGVNLGVNNTGAFGSLSRGPGAVGEATVTLNANFGNQPSGLIIGGTLAGATKFGGRINAGWSSGGGFFLNLGAGYGFAAYAGLEIGPGGYLHKWDDGD